MAIAKKKKRFFEVDIPIINKTTYLYAYTLKDTEKRIIKYDLTRILKGKNALLSTEVRIDGEKATSIPKKFEIVQTFIRKVVRKRTNYVEDSISLECKDAQIRIKPLLVTRRKISKRVRKALREKTKEELLDYSKNKKVDEIFSDTLKSILQKSLSLKLKKIYPLSLCEIRILNVEKRFEKKEQ
jgi:ribosomal protein S3AE